jgi:hypothetical protein
MKTAVANKQFGVMAGERLRLNVFGLLKLVLRLKFIGKNPPQTPSCQNVMGKFIK